jgi:hypothetical protein
MEQREFLRKQMLKKTREKIEEKFAGKEIHIIKAVNLLTDLDSVSNLLMENLSEWKKRSPTGEAMDAFNSLEENLKNIEGEKKTLTEFIEKEINAELPNFSAIATPVLGAKMLASAGSKKKLCFFPASTLQVLGAEKALFAHLRRGAKSPKHGHLFNHPLLQNLSRTKRGNAARMIAGKLAISLKQDYFGGENTSEEVLKELREKIDVLAKAPEKERQQKEETQFVPFPSTAKKSESKTFTPEERKAYFAQQKNSAPKEVQRQGNYQDRPQNRYRDERGPREQSENYSSRRPTNYGRRSSQEFGEERRDRGRGYYNSEDSQRPRTGHSFRPRSFEERGNRDFRQSYKTRDNYSSAEDRHAKPSAHGFGGGNRYQSNRNKRFGPKRPRTRY